MPNILQAVQSPADVRQNVQTFNIEAAQFYDRAARLLRETTYWVYDPVSESFGPSKFVGFTEMSFDRYVRAVAGESEGARFDGTVTQTAISTALGTSYREDENLRSRLESWGVERFGPDAFGGADRQKWRFVSLPAVAETARARLQLELHGRYTRADVYGLFNINYYARRTRHLNVGLSPRMPDGGYQLFITLDKDTLAPDYDYEDILFQDQLIWVTRRGADEDDDDSSRCAIQRRDCPCSSVAKARTRSCIWVRSAQRVTSSSPTRAALNSVTTWRSRCRFRTRSLLN